MKIFRLFCLLVVMHYFHTTSATIFLESSSQPNSVNLSQPCVGYLELEDAIMTSRVFKKRLAALIEHPLIVGIILNISSGGGSATASWEIYEAIKRANTKKPIVSYIEGVCASGAYLAACATSRIISNSMATVGSIGVVRTIEKLEPTSFKENGVKGKITIHRFKKGKFKQLGSPYDPINDEEIEQLNEEIDFLHDRFCSDVAACRGLTYEEVASQESLTFTGIQALELGLIDQTGDFDDALIALIHELAHRGITGKGTLLTPESLKESLIMESPALQENLKIVPYGTPFEEYRTRNWLYANCD